MSRGQSGAMTRYFDHHRIFAAVAIGLLILALPAAPAQAAGEGGFTVARVSVSDDKSVFASVRSADTVPARARIAGTIVELKVDEGRAVSAGAVVALVADEKLALRAEAIDAQIAAATSEVENARAERERASALFERGTISKARMDQLDTALSVAENRLRAAQAERQVISQQVTEGAVLAPQAGRVLTVPVSRGAVVLPGEPVAVIAIDRRQPEAQVNRGAALLQLHRFGPAIASFTEALGLGVQEPYKAYFNRGAAREALGDVRGAYEDYNTALEIYPDWGPANAELQRFARQRREHLQTVQGSAENQ